MGLGMAALAACAAVGAAGGRASADEPETPRPPRERRVVRVHRGGGYLGVSLNDLAAADVKRLGLSDERGALVRDVVEQSPAAKAGLKDDDVIVTFEGEQVRSAAHLGRLVRETPPGRSVAVGYVRGGTRQQAQVTVGEPRRARLMEGLADLRIEGLDKLKIEGLDKLEERLGDLELPEPPEPPEVPDVPEAPEPPEPPMAFGRSGDAFTFDFMGARPRLGVQVVELTDQLARHFGVPDGILVSGVRSGSAADKAGLRAGDIILKVDGEAVASGRELVRRVARGDSARQVTLTVQRDGKPMDVRVQLEPRRTPRGPTT
jgi:membrane-associated protease RseP (regulator of RpoE activity)